ncbi:hypothetical protein GCM10012284_58530 [Mangrovihabitans endophyticus]|uniref:Uncharacterized protein n=1 Tax=Mangrovihabitans endophyticus TaxID=1751298 RepID=A0A8J3C7E4_9ACTN|nr:hypothetical protein GCM10012284_58530 [Mangrovihabitans endophyticus]
MPLTLTKADFEAFWEEVLTDDWAIDDWSTDRGDAIDDLAPGDVFTIKTISLFWQGNTVPEPTPWISARQLDNGPDFIQMFRAWAKARSQVTMSFTVPADRIGEIAAAVTALGGKQVL